MKERISFSRPEGLGGTVVLTASGSRRRWRMAHETFTLTVVTRGTGKWRCRGADGSLHPGQVLLIAPGDVHTTKDVDRPGSFCALFLPPEVVRTLVFPNAATADGVHFKGIAATDADTVGAMDQLRVALAAPAPDPFEVSQLAALGLRTLFERHADDVPHQPTASPMVVLQAADLIRAAFEDDPSTPGLTVESLACALGVSSTALIRGFSKAMGLPPYQFLLRLRIERARRIIEDGPEDDLGLGNLTDVSMACGFYDLSHMGRVFRKVIGVSPSFYASQIGSSGMWRWTEKARS
jgi:AraC-like DNA-binding protein/quercetin dioxygenase-like cupin family protein